ncbi:uncharacterized protein LACBIDRAFT_300200 [Laccaria bicolor S238N-H82]|uniref:Predicted protein n=1 Tax=Laccaria bicolor (strain S238N-H82 / ATCC MYA-4686) TaxID=486041 RepID=B0DG98_LACBS|nr:uncharacterized protein LACBIDRAFT_300200 [Laccaria bicolor S238N-H82]EDR06477.1 predicted protein [Laccaria bicolor S238N-H82]|eukprot:XP_001882849.1 predicted protein [Laccaria bicolor S238N-H82]
MVYQLRLPDTYSMHPEYKVESILGHRFVGKKKANRRMFLVRWKGYGPADDSWVSEYDLRNSAQLKRSYLDSKGLTI